jgi:hypothetical protein
MGSLGGRHSADQGVSGVRGRHVRGKDQSVGSFHGIGHEQLPKVSGVRRAHDCNRHCNALWRRCDAMQCNAMRCTAMRCNAMQCNAVGCNLMR